MAYQVNKISDHFWRIEDEVVRCFLYAGAERALLVDSGQCGGDLHTGVSDLTSLPITLVNTHADPDHTSSNGQFGTVFLHPAEYGMYRVLNGTGHQLSPLWDGDIIDLGTQKFQVIHMPGHTPGSITLLNLEERILLGGDGIQNGSIFLFNLYGTRRSLEAHVQSMERLWQKYRDDFDLVYPSHADVPLPKSVIPALIRDAKAVLEGRCPGVDLEYDAVPYRSYTMDAATFMCNRF